MLKLPTAVRWLAVCPRSRFGLVCWWGILCPRSRFGLVWVGPREMYACIYIVILLLRSRTSSRELDADARNSLLAGIPTRSASEDGKRGFGARIGSGGEGDA